MPEGIVGEADHVEGNALGHDVVVELAAPPVVAALVPVQHDPKQVALRVPDPSTLHPRLQECSQRTPAAARGPVDLAYGPQDAVADLVADRDHVGWSSLSGECGDHLLRVGADRVGEPRQVLTLPGVWRRLVLGVGPEVGVVDVEKELHPGCLDAPSRRQVVPEIKELKLAEPEEPRV